MSTICDGMPETIGELELDTTLSEVELIGKHSDLGAPCVSLGVSLTGDLGENSDHMRV